MLRELVQLEEVALPVPQALVPQRPDERVLDRQGDLAVARGNRPVGLGQERPQVFELAFLSDHDPRDVVRLVQRA